MTKTIRDNPIANENNKNGFGIFSSGQRVLRKTNPRNVVMKRRARKLIDINIESERNVSKNIMTEYEIFNCIYMLYKRSQK